MKEGNQEHHHGRNPRGFEPHNIKRGERSLRRGRAWRFNFGAGFAYPTEPHYRVTARIAALPGKHVRAVREPVRAAHGKAI